MNEPTHTSAPAGFPRPLVSSGFDKATLFGLFFFAAYFFLVYQLLRILSPFLMPLLAAAMLTLVVYPLREVVLRRIPWPSAAAFALTILVMITVIVPVTVLVWLLTREATAAIPTVSAWLTTQQAEGWTFAQGSFPVLEKAWHTASKLFDLIKLDLGAVTLEAIREVGNGLTSVGAFMVREFFVFVFQLAVMVCALFFFLRDGPKIIGRILDLIPMEDDNKHVILLSLDRTLVAMLRGTIVTAAAQALLAGIGLWIFGVPFPVLLGFATAFLAVVPFVGAATVWLPAALYLLLTDHAMAAAGMAVWGFAVVSLVDNLLRPIVVGGHAQLPPTVLFLGILGGFQVYGLVGGLISPLVIAGVFSLAGIYRQRYVETP